MIRLFFGTVIAASLCVGANYAAGTWWAKWFGLAAVVFAIAFCWHEEREVRDLVRWERREARRDRRVA